MKPPDTKGFFAANIADMDVVLGGSWRTGARSVGCGVTVGEAVVGVTGVEGGSYLTVGVFSRVVEMDGTASDVDEGAVGCGVVTSDGAPIDTG